MLALCALILVCAGVIGGYWIVSVSGVLIFALSGYWLPALVAALMLDLLFGPAVGIFELLVYPIAVGTAALVLVRAFLIRHLRDRRLY